jgi:malate dehydrogenase
MTTTVTLTGAGGQIGYALLFRIAAGDMAAEPAALQSRTRCSFPTTLQFPDDAAASRRRCSFPTTLPFPDDAAVSCARAAHS